MSLDKNVVVCMWHEVNFNLPSTCLRTDSLLQSGLNLNSVLTSIHPQYIESKGGGPIHAFHPRNHEDSPPISVEFIKIVLV